MLEQYFDAPTSVVAEWDEAHESGIRLRAMATPRCSIVHACQFTKELA